MTAFNVVRFCVKPGHEESFVQAHRQMKPEFKGLQSAHLVKIGDRRYCFVGQWDSQASLVAARPGMVALLDGFRSQLEDLGNGLGVTDPVSGEVVATMKG